MPSQMMLYFLESVTVCVRRMEELVFKSEHEMVAPPDGQEIKAFPALWKICEDHRLGDVLFLSLRVSFGAHTWIRVDLPHVQNL